MDISRRAFVKATAVALASAAAAGSLASMTGCASGGEGAAAGGGEGQKHTAVCRFCGCGCGVICETRDGKLVSVTGDPENLSNKGLNCVKGYFLGKILYGDDRLTKPLIREDKSTKGTDEGLREASWDEALELVSSKLKETWKADKSRLAFWLSGQQPITEGYACAKFIKAGLLSNNVDPNARLCMASAVVGFMNVFQTDEPAGCYADLDNADVFVTWGANMAEAHPMLYSRLTARKLSGENVKHYDLGTLRTRTSVSADTVMLFKPNTDLAIANCIANYLVQNKKYDEAFVNDHLQFKQGTEDIGNATDDGYDASEIGQKVDAVTSITFDEYAARLAPYTFEYTSELSGVPVEDLKALAFEFADPDKNIMSLWTMGVNQHNRGTWMNHNLYNIHLLSGKIARPGCGPFSLTGQPTACGTAREVGTFSHRLPADLLVANAQHRRYTEAIWDLPEGYLDAIQKPGMHTVKIFREMSKGNIDFLWTAHNNWAQSMPNLQRFLGRGEDRQGIFDTFIVVNEVYPTLSTQYADVVLPVALWVEREGQFGNAERRSAVFEKAVDPPGEAKWDLWAFMEVAHRVLDGEQIDGKDSFDHLFGFIYDKAAHDFKNDSRETNRLLWEEYRVFSNPEMNDKAKAINDDADGTFDAKLKMEAKQLAPYEEYLAHHGMTWPVRNVDGKWLETHWRFADGKQEDGFDEVGVAKYGKPGLANNLSFYKSGNMKPSVVFRPYEPPAETPDDEYPFYFCTGRLLEHWHTGTMTRRVPELDRALPEALLNIHPNDASKLGVADGDLVHVKSRFGEFDIKASTAGRTEPQEGIVFAPFFAEETLVNLAVQDTYCPLSKEPDYKKTCVSITKVEG
ncbi:periplasmic nitrate reductase subunit alpha [Gordonibacter sp. 28C]|uniref:molybdopterin-dependent oxidoreductase n=1 Tax=Gordonibacter sp. 28C TaxID=2078569 RepID=UPI000DF775D2|nr:molybdopterin-dependent oxidoreductase [Gordonibacter sp. 28C]RDB59470.1 periplasmic nitrate reductase subunit alpha [Gordonibacter sp. 28C]